MVKELRTVYRNNLPGMLETFTFIHTKNSSVNSIEYRVKLCTSTSSDTIDV